MKTHTTCGAESLKEVYDNNQNEYLKMAIEIANYHHEKWDGTGYPCGLKEEEIPLAARIVAIVDVYDILTSKRCYRDAYSHEEAISIMQEESGKSFDPNMMEIFLKIQNRFRKESA